MSSAGGIKEGVTHGGSDGDDGSGNGVDAILAACASVGGVAERAKSAGSGAGSGAGGGHAASASSDGGGGEVASSKGGGGNAESMSSKSGHTNFVCACARACARVGGKRG